MFYNLNKQTTLDGYITTFFATYKDKIIQLKDADFKEEKFCGSSEKKFWMFDYYLALYYTIAVYHAKNYSDDYAQLLIDKEYEKMRDCLACSPARIDLDAIFDIFNMSDVVDGDGPTPVEYDLVVPISELLNEENSCSVYFDTDGGYEPPAIIDPPVAAPTTNILYGKNNGIAATQALVDLLADTGQIPSIYTTVTFPAGLAYLYIGIPIDQLGIFNDFKDADTMFLLATASDTWDLTVRGVAYRFYRSQNRLSGAKNIQII